MSGATSSSVRPHTLDDFRQQLELSLQALVTRMKAPRLPINLIISGPPGYDTRILCQFFSRECGFVYYSLDPVDQEPMAAATAAVVAPGASPSSPTSKTTRYYNRHAVERDQGAAAYTRHLQEAEQVVRSYCQISETTSKADLAARVMSQHLLNLQRFVFRHLVNVPTTDSMINADRSVWERPLWRVFHGAPNDEIYGYAATSSELRLIDDGMFAVIQTQGKMATDVMFKDCSPSTTLWIYCAPKREVYSELVEMAVRSPAYTQHASSLGFGEEQTRQYYWQTYHFLDGMYRQSVFTTSYWSLHLETQTTFMDRVTMLSIANVVLTYLVDTLFAHKFWADASTGMRHRYLELQQTMSERVKYVPSFAPAPTITTGVSIPPLSSGRFGIRDSTSSSSSTTPPPPPTTTSTTTTTTTTTTAYEDASATTNGIDRTSSSSSSVPAAIGTRHSSPQRTLSDHRLQRVREEMFYDNRTHVSGNAVSLQQLRVPVDLEKERRRKEKERRNSASATMQTVDLGI